MVHTIAADRGDAGIRLDLVVRRHLVGTTAAATRTQVQHWIEDGRVSINDVVVRRVATRTMSGDIVTIALPESAVKEVMSAEPVPLDLLYEDSDLLVINKPAGVVVHPTYKHKTQTIMNGLLWHGRDWPDGSRPSIVGRLDKQTSGLVVVAKRPDVHAQLQQTLASRHSAKDYLAIAFGIMPRDSFQIALPLGRDPGDRRRVMVRDDGQRSLTQITRLAERADDPALVLAGCRLMTGRMHQIRVHLSASGWPIAGDAKYGRALDGLDRQALHAWRVSLAHPRTQQPLTVEAPVPDDMRASLAEHFPHWRPAPIP